MERTENYGPRDPRIERVLHAAEQHGLNSEADHEVGDLQGVLRAAWALMSPEQRNHLMSAAETLEVLQEGDNYVEVARLRGCLMRDDGFQRVVIEVTRPGGGQEPEVTSVKVFDGRASEIDASGAGLRGVEHLARRLDHELLEAMPPQSVEPAWVSTIDWDLDRDVLTHSVQIAGVDRNIQASRWFDASNALDRQELPLGVDRWQEERVVVMELEAGIGASNPRWAEVTLNSNAIEQLCRGESVRLGGPTIPVVAGGTPIAGKAASTEFDDQWLEVRYPALADVTRPLSSNVLLQLRGSNAEGWPTRSASIPMDRFIKWMKERRAGEILFIDIGGVLLNDQADFERFHAWVDEYHHIRGADEAEPQTEFEVEVPRG